MALRTIIKEGNEILRKVAKPIKYFDEDLWALLDDMKETLLKSTGVGLACPQVGVLKRAFVINLNGAYFEVINPRIVKVEGKQCGQEGCLSVPNRFEEITRPRKVTIEFVDRYNNPMSLTAVDFMARAFCHENDHLNGVLFVDLVGKK